MGRVAGLLVLLLLLVPGCGSRSTGMSDFREVTYHLAGGVAGYNRQIAIAADGTFQVVDRGKPFVKGSLPNRTLKQLKEAIAEVEWQQLDQQYVNARVADAVTQTITVKSSDQEFKTVVSTGSSPPRALANLATILRQVLSERTLN